jgi:hypothetical protein
VARVEVEDSWIVSGDRADVRLAVQRFLVQQKMKIIAEEEREFVADHGSQFLTRLLGGWFVPASWLPMRATVRLRQVDNGTRVSTTIEEKMGFGIIDPLFERKYRNHFETWVDELRMTLSGDRNQ